MCLLQKNYYQYNWTFTKIKQEKKTLIVLNEKEVLVATSILKVLLNCSNALKFISENDEKLISDISSLFCVLQRLLAVEKENSTLQMVIARWSIYLISDLIPSKCTAPLLLQSGEQDVSGCEAREILYDGVCMNAPQEVIYYFLDVLTRYDNCNPAVDDEFQGIVAVLKLMCHLSSTHRPIRKYYRAVVLPPIKVPKQRPEIGDSLSSRVCRLLTHPNDDIRNCVFEFVIIITKGNVKRLYKYFGYGNVAGLLSLRLQTLSNYNYSDEENSDTEEYSQHVSTVNPVTGCIEPEKPDLVSGMSDEQKEVEGLKLLNDLSRLERLGLIKPSTIGPDGKPKEVNHVLQLLEDIPKEVDELGQKIRENDINDKDSDR